MQVADVMGLLHMRRVLRRRMAVDLHYLGLAERDPLDESKGIRMQTNDEVDYVEFSLMLLSEKGPPSHGDRSWAVVHEMR
jgi:hypothetical protein